ncbi:hypothetical protein QBC33DRAFT_541433 [Phialemonium atrogriseum]|uniref:Uncharacterized protein n=1 Tax=Phialemonium atrogriseum TaxID=1093897 RepID=A0AAJ0BYB1_9PEZI|nr:uncharacterized protein QBC33DRAFT_541433 [Phialemonium atrogriseum]KAK1766555.1 hypothetical protein QBC33DRAFT_541433 [Phialemonium atrogriseum]
MLHSFQSCLPQARTILLVGHDIRHEMHALHKLKFNFHKSSISGMLGTFRIRGRVLPGLFSFYPCFLLSVFLRWT